MHPVVTYEIGYCTFEQEIIFIFSRVENATRCTNRGDLLHLNSHSTFWEAYI